jgi:hypothetical protein
LSDLRLHEPEIAGLATLRDMPEETLNDFLSQLEKAPTSVPQLRDASAPDVERAFDALSSLYQGRTYFEVEPGNFVSDLERTLKDKAGWSSTDWSLFRKRLERLFNIESLSVSAKAVLLQLENERRYHEARVLTDLRPVFGADPSQPPKAAIISHALRLAYHDNSNEIKEFYISLDSIDISEFIQVLVRAQEKEQTLSTFLDAVRLRVIGRQ